MNAILTFVLLLLVTPCGAAEPIYHYSCEAGDCPTSDDIGEILLDHGIHADPARFVLIYESIPTE